MPFKIQIQSLEIEKFQGQYIGHEIKILKKDSAGLIFEKKPKSGYAQCIYSPPMNGKDKAIVVLYVLLNKEHYFTWATKKASLLLKTSLQFVYLEKVRVAKWKT
ncbi:MAG: hypothetical protein M3P22_00625 [bacterium]|nr:hypothetical protein [bacterium]